MGRVVDIGTGFNLATHLLVGILEEGLHIVFHIVVIGEFEAEGMLA